ncbi:MAG: hypothetical protein JO149_02545 [Gammaproteobacteria bacterium]|nr:hypothetical protein [Gammaproteobacteria bacterium]
MFGHDEIPLKVIKSKELTPEELRQLDNNERAELAGKFLDSFTLTAIYFMFVKDFLHQILEEFVKYILFPAVIFFSAWQAITAWRRAWLEKGKSRNNIFKAIVETVATLAISVAVIGSIAAATIFGAIAPFIFTAVTTFKALFHLGSACYFGYKAATASDPVKKAEHRAMAKQHGIATAAGVLALAAVVGVFVLGKVVMAGVGIVVAFFGMGVALYKAMVGEDKPKPENEVAQPIIENETDKQPNNDLTKDHQPVPSHSMSIPDNVSHKNIQPPVTAFSVANPSINISHDDYEPITLAKSYNGPTMFSRKFSENQMQTDSDSQAEVIYQVSGVSTSSDESAATSVPTKTRSFSSMFGFLAAPSTKIKQQESTSVPSSASTCSFQRV